MVVAVLLAVFGSGVGDVTFAVLERVPGPAVTVTTIETDAEPRLGRVPMLAVTVPELKMQEPCVGVQETKEVPTGSVLVMLIELDGPGPRLLMLTV